MSHYLKNRLERLFSSKPLWTFAVKSPSCDKRLCVWGEQSPVMGNFGQGVSMPNKFCILSPRRWILWDSTNFQCNRSDDDVVSPIKFGRGTSSSAIPFATPTTCCQVYGGVVISPTFSLVSWQNSYQVRKVSILEKKATWCDTT